MRFRQFYLACLAHASYLVADGGECAVVDPQRDVDQYIDEAAHHGLTIRYVLETHLHADFVSGHRELADRTGAQIVIGARAGATFPHLAVSHGDTLPLGNIELRAIETPGHTPEGISWLVLENGTPLKVLTGDTLFIGDVGRPDLAGAGGYTPAQMATALYDSLHTKLLTLPDDVEVWPAHGAGSACGRNISKETSSTIGIQRRTNYALAPMTAEEFVAMMTADLTAPPPYFAKDAEMNRHGADKLRFIAPRMCADDARPMIDAGAIPLDVRDAGSFAASHIPQSINIGLGGQFASWAGTLLSFQTPIVLITEDEERAKEAVTRLARVGLENVAGWISFDDWTFDTRSLAQITPAELHETGGALPVLDVRGAGEFASGHVPGARHIALTELAARIGELPPGKLAVICAGGYRSSIAASLLARAGRDAVVNVAGGTSAWISEGFGVATPSQSAAAPAAAR
jgi:hydroxyacylglutathione hydrolase